MKHLDQIWICLSLSEMLAELVLLALVIAPRDVRAAVEAQSATSIIEANREFNLLWITPLQVVNARPLGYDDAFNAKLAKAALAAYSSIVDGNKAFAGGDSANGANEAFYEAQSKAYDESGGSYIDALRTDEFAEVQRLVRASAISFLEGAGQTSHAARVANASMFCWVSVHERGTSHLPHVHADALISTIYYVNMPSGAGSTIFYDPRGALPPFGNKYIVTPQEGQLFVFPGWLQHSVSATWGQTSVKAHRRTKQPRISVSCNVNGSWDVTTDMSLKM